MASPLVIPDDLRPQPGPQEKFLGTEADICLYGGQAGGGKTFAVVLEGSRHVANPGFRAIFFRKTRPQIRALGGLWDTSTRIFPSCGGSPRENTLEWRFPSGAIIKFDFLNQEEDKYRHDGAQYALVVFDEVQHQTESQFWYIVGRANRSTCGVTPYVRGTCNPDVSSWVRELIDWWIGADGIAIPERSGVVRYLTRNDEGEILWVDKDWEGPNGERPKSFTFIAASVTDNPALLAANPGYLDSLRQLPPEERDRLLFGNWNARPKMRGRIYPEFDRVGHFINESHAEYLQATQISQGHFQPWEGWDFGTGATAATVVVWGYYDKTADVLYLWDWAMNWEQTVDWWAEEVGRHGYFVQNRQPWDHPTFKDNVKGVRPYERVADPAGKQRDSEQKHWFSRLDEEFGIELTPGVNRPTETILTFRHMMLKGRIKLHPRMAERRGVGPLRGGGGRERKSFADAFQEYQWKVKADWDPARDGDSAGSQKAKKNWASHPMDAVGYIVRNIWGFVPRGYIPLKPGKG